MTTEEKAKAYDKTIEKLRDFYRDYDTVSCLIGVKDELANLFPELRESEDEKVRKALLDYFKWNPNGQLLNEFSNREVFAWLENQSEQKSVEWHREDEQNLNACLGYIPDEFLRRWLTDVIHIKYDKTAWSEEDEGFLDSALWHIKNSITNGKIKAFVECPLSTWLKSLKERVGCEVNCTTTKEWSDEDDLQLNEAIEAVNESSYSSKRKNVVIDWLKSIRPQNTWKPSDEQMEGLLWVLENCAEREGASKMLSLANSIYDTLKNLKG